MTQEPGLANLHHHDILTEALTRFERDYGARDRNDIVEELRRNVDPGPMPIRRIADQVPTVQSGITRPPREDGSRDPGPSGA
jgi:hypothetical protein